MQTDSALGPADDFRGGNPAAGPSHGGPSGETPGTPEPRPSRPRRATARFMLSHPLHLISLGFGSGLSPVGPQLLAMARNATTAADPTATRTGTTQPGRRLTGVPAKSRRRIITHAPPRQATIQITLTMHAIASGP